MTLFGLFALLQSVSPITLAGINQWTGNGPEGGEIKAMVMDLKNPSTLYVGTLGGVFKTTNGGASWSPSNTGLNSAEVSTLSIAPSNPATLYTVTAGGLFKSVTGGFNWSSVNPSVTAALGWTLTVDPSDPNALYARTIKDGMFKSTDGGINWHPFVIGETNLSIDAFYIAPSNPAIRYAKVASALYRSANGGESWTYINDYYYTRVERFAAFAIDPSNPDTIYISQTGSSGQWSSFMKSTNGGKSWEGYQVSAAWPPILASALAIDPSAPATLYLGTEVGVYKSTDGGKKWIYSAGLGTLFISTLIIDPSNPDTVYAGTNGGVFKSANRGLSWNLANTGLTAATVVNLVIDPSDPSTLYAGTESGVFKSMFAGGGWSSSNNGLAYPSLTTLAIAPSNPSLFFSAASYGRRAGSQLFTSTDSAKSWKPASTSGIQSVNPEGGPPRIDFVAIDPSNSATRYIATTDRRLYKSTDSGNKWFRANQLISSGSNLVFDISVSTLVIDPTNTATLYAGNNSRVSKSTNAAESWVNASSGIPDSFHNILTLYIDPSQPTTLYAGTAGGGVFKTTDGAKNWKAASVGLPTNVSVNTLIIDSSTPSTLYAGTNAGVFKSDNGAVSWSLIPKTGWTGQSVLALLIDPTDRSTLYAGTQGGGVIKFTSRDSTPAITDCLLNWAERNYPALFAPAGTSTFFSGIYAYRYYADSSNFLGVSSLDHHIYLLGMDGALRDIGAEESWLPETSCQVITTPQIECLLNWAETNYGNWFSPSGSPTETWDIYTYRHYAATKTYLGVSTADYHFYSLGTDGILHDEGTVSHWLPKTGCY